MALNPTILLLNRLPLCPEIMLVGGKDSGHDQTIDLRCIGMATANGALVVDLIDQDLDTPSHLGSQLFSADPCLCFHEPLQTLLFDFLRYGTGQGVGGRSLNGGVGETAHAIETRLLDEVEEFLEFGLGLAGKTDDKGTA